MSDQNDGLLPDEASNALREELFCYRGVNCTERIIKKIDVSITVACSSQRDACSLSS